MLIRLLRTHLRPYGWQIAIVLVMQTIQAVANLFLPTLNADIIDNGVAKGDTGYIMSTGGLMLAATIGQVVCAIVAVYFGAKVASAFGRDVRQALFDRVETFSAREVARFGAPSLITRTTNDVQQVQMLVLMTLIMLLMAPVSMIGGTALALAQDVELSAILLVVIPVMVVFVALMLRAMSPIFRGVQTGIDTINRILREQIGGVRVIRAFVHDDYERERFDASNTYLTRLQTRAGRIFSLMFPFVMLMMNVCSVAVIWFGGHRVADQAMETGALTAFITYLMQILMSLLMASMMFIFVPRAQVCAERIEEVLRTDSTVVQSADAVTHLPRPGELAMTGAVFRYPGAEHPVLRDITFAAHPGQTLAIIGSTGSGKTTLLNLIPRLFDATEGSVEVGGTDVRRTELQTLWADIGLVPQKAYLFSGTIASNLRYGKPDATDGELWQALEVAQAKEFVEALEDGLESEVSQGGTNFSGGQRQRLAMARALVRRPALYLFDDSFSALDYATDARLRAALKSVTGGSTVVIVGQRVSTIRDADKILVLDAGRIVGQGTHGELLADCQTYQEIVYSQMSMEEAA
ncbi:MAG: ABC transporter ATP-binding protein/permease [Propionibacteriaceae bacterium]|jgi:ATP-binding cassette subfamily B protein|nr:ABC transporter ATP-binding protein/permease [Propionibacteriaceae bacterium]